MWFTKSEQPARAGLFYCFSKSIPENLPAIMRWSPTKFPGTSRPAWGAPSIGSTAAMSAFVIWTILTSSRLDGVGSMMGGILFYAVGFEKNFPVWKVIFLLCGGVTVLWGLVLMYYLPNNIMQAKRFTPEEKALLIARSQTNQTGIYNRKIKTSQIWEALSDPQVWILFCFVLLNETINGGVANFGKLIVKGVAGGDALRATAYGIPQGAFQVFWVFTGPFLASKIPNSRTIIMAIYILPTITGAILMWKLPRSNTVGCLFAYYIVSILAPRADVG